MNNESLAKPAVSVVVPIYNVEEYLEECLDSLVNQTLRNIEVILVDDGSTDSSGEIAQRYAKDYDNFFYYRKINGGLGSARNYGTDRARGEYIVYIDSDDVVARDIYEKMYVKAVYDDSDMAICNVQRFNSSKTISSPIHDRAFKGIPSVANIYDYPVLINDTTAWNKLIRMSFMKEHGYRFPEGILYEDIPVTIPIHCTVNHVSVVHSYGYLWRVRDGVSKSITQQVDSEKNLYDRLTVMRKLDDFFEQNPPGEEVLKAWRVKSMEIDLSIFINQLPLVDDETAALFMREVKKYIEERIEQKYISQTSIICEKKVRAVLDGDLERARELRKFELDYYWTAPTHVEDGRVIADLPEDLFGTDRRDITDELNRNSYRDFIDDIKVWGSTIEVFGHVYARRQPLHMGDQTARVFLNSSATGDRIEVAVEPWACESLTRTQGSVFDKYSNEVTNYDYDGSGFKATIDLSDDRYKDIPQGELYLTVEYANPFKSGMTALNYVNKSKIAGVRDIAALYENRHLCVTFDEFNHLKLYSSTKDAFVDSIEYKDNLLVLHLDDDVDEVFIADNDDESTIHAEKTAPCEFGLYTDDMEFDIQYFVYSQKGGSEPDKLAMKERDIQIVDLDSQVLIARTLRQYNLRLERRSSLASVESIKRKGNVLDFEVRIVGEVAARQISRYVLQDENRYTKNIDTLSVGQVKQDDPSLIAFHVDFADESLTKNLYSAFHNMTLGVVLEDGSEESLWIYSHPYFNHHFKNDWFDAIIYRDASGRMMLRVTTMWPDDLSNFAKRKAAVVETYPRYRSEKINKKLILFESMWGSKYSCNPRALYEYIDANHPEYTCVWSLSDERQPINGRGIRVRRWTPEYFHYLATAKYLVNNVNFPDEYEKRSGQIEIQTMHGTPLKTLGLDVEADFPTAESREAYIKKNSRWDYIMCQGRFIDELVDDIFGVTPKHLHSGYPRTDSLLSASEEYINGVKDRLQLPKDKKIILYAPTWRKRNSFDMMLNLDRMKERLDDEYVLLVRLHHFSASGYTVPADNEFIYDMTSYGSIDDLYLISDVMITDYSSTMFDYALLKKPMLFFTYDLEQYANELRGMYVDFEKEAPGPLLYSSEEVIDALERLDSITKEYKSKMEDFREKYVGYEVPNSSELIFQEVFKTDSLGERIKRMLHRKPSR